MISQEDIILFSGVDIKAVFSDRHIVTLQDIKYEIIKVTPRAFPPGKIGGLFYWESRYPFDEDWDLLTVAQKKERKKS